MSKRYEILDFRSVVLTGRAAREEFPDEDFTDDAVALVMGNPWATAGVIIGSPDEIADRLHLYLATVKAARDGG